MISDPAVRARLGERMTLYGPWVTFGGTLLLLAWLTVSPPGPIHAIGFAAGEPFSIAPAEPARVLSVAVEPGQEVAAGQILASVDAAAVEAELAIAEAERAALTAEAAAEAAGVAREERSERGDLEVAVARAQIALQEQEEAYARAEAGVRALESERARIRSLLGEGLATRDDLGRIEIAHAEAKQRAAEKPETIRILREQLRDATARRDQAAASDGAGVAVAPLHRQIEVVERRIEDLARRRAEATLRAPTHGRVTEVLKRPGEIAARDMPVVAMVRSRVDRVAACLAERDALAVHEGDAAVLRLRGGVGPLTRGRVISLGPFVDELPERCQTSVLRRARGRNAVVLLDDEIETLPGQAFDVRFVSGDRPGNGAVAVAAERDEKPRPMRVPEKLSRHSRFEPSGALWQADLLRYLVVSDDTGREIEHVPWLFTMDVEGHVDADPLAVTGINELNDLESVASDADGSIYLLSSQSHSSKGNRPRSRTAFLRVAAAGRSYAVTGEVHIAEALDGADASLRARLGLESGTRELEIEGLAVRAGAAYFGLKAPLDAAGNAMIWRLPDVRGAFDAERFDPDRLELWARVPLRAQAGGADVAAGISDLLFLPDGTLLLTATPAAGDGATESGCIVHVAHAQPGLLVPRVVRTFPGMRPEGLSIAPAPGRFLVVFDAGEADPFWIDLPWPG